MGAAQTCCMTFFKLIKTSNIVRRQFLKYGNLPNCEIWKKRERRIEVLSLTVVTKGFHCPDTTGMSVAWAARPVSTQCVYRGRRGWSWNHPGEQSSNSPAGPLPALLVALHPACSHHHVWPSTPSAHTHTHTHTHTRTGFTLLKSFSLFLLELTRNPCFLLTPVASLGLILEGAATGHGDPLCPHSIQIQPSFSTFP